VLIGEGKDIMKTHGNTDSKNVECLRMKAVGSKKSQLKRVAMWNTAGRIIG
jgi:hypothetical protein